MRMGDCGGVVKRGGGGGGGGGGHVNRNTKWDYLKSIINLYRPVSFPFPLLTFFFF